MNTPTLINLYGASGHAKVVADVIAASGARLGAVYDDVPLLTTFCGRPVAVPSPGGAKVDGPLIVAIGSNRARRRVAERCSGLEFAIAVHPTAWVSPSAHLGRGTVVMAGAIVQADAEIGRHCIVNTGASVDHECRLADFVHISPHATLCGNVTVGGQSWIGAGAVVIPGVTIGSCATIGAGSVVISDIPDGATAVGNPCKIIKISDIK